MLNPMLGPYVTMYVGVLWPRLLYFFWSCIKHLNLRMHICMFLELLEWPKVKREREVKGECGARGGEAA